MSKSMLKLSDVLLLAAEILFVSVLWYPAHGIGQILKWKPCSLAEEFYLRSSNAYFICAVLLAVIYVFDAFKTKRHQTPSIFIQVSLTVLFVFLAGFISAVSLAFLK